MNLETERELLATVTRLSTQWTGVDLATANTYLRDKLGTARYDQMDAAAAEATAMVQALRGEKWGVSGKVAVLLMAGVLRCFDGTHCAHAADGERPLFGLLAPRVISCMDCMPKYMDTIAESDIREHSTPDPLCDLCLQPTTQFWQFCASYGPSVLQGDVCPECRALFGGPGRG